MISPEEFYRALDTSGVSYYSGVPDSLLKSFCAYVTGNAGADRHVIAANEGGAVGLGIGHYLATGELPLIYLQNSGLGNIVNPITSLVDKDVYGIPMILLVGWRGEPDVQDEPQHVKQGRITTEMLDVLETPYTILDGSEQNLPSIVEHAVRTAKAESMPYAFVVKKNTFAKYELDTGEDSVLEMTREEAITVLLDGQKESDLIVATTGMPSREIFEYRTIKQQEYDKDFLSVGGMGHASQIALSVAKNHPQRDVYCFDGDGAALMHLGGLAIIGQSGVRNYKHIILNNGAHDSVGGQPTVGFEIDFLQVALSLGYEDAKSVDSKQALAESIDWLQSSEGPVLLEVKVRKGNRDDLGRPTISPAEGKNNYMSQLG